MSRRRTRNYALVGWWTKSRASATPMTEHHRENSNPDRVGAKKLLRMQEAPDPSENSSFGSDTSESVTESPQGAAEDPTEPSVAPSADPVQQQQRPEEFEPSPPEILTSTEIVLVCCPRSLGAPFWNAAYFCHLRSSVLFSSFSFSLVCSTGHTRPVR